MYKELLLFPEQLKGQTIYPDMARKIVALACNGLPVNPAIFARDEQGKTLQGRFGDDRKGEGFGIPSPIVFDGGLGFIRIYGIGKTGSDLLTDQAMTLVAALSKHFNSPFRMEFKQGDCSLKMSQPFMYGIRRLVVAKKSHQLNHFFGVSATERASEIKKEILRGLISTARWLDKDLGGQSMLESQIPSENSIILDVLEGESVPVEIKPGIPAAAFKNVVFCTNLDINGPWSVGKMRSRGYGLVRRRIG